MTVIYTAVVGGKNYGFDFADQRIDVDATVDSLFVTNLYLAIKQAQASTEGVSYNRIAKGGGTDVLGTGIETFLTVTLLDNWEVNSLKGGGKFEVLGGNLIRSDQADPFRDNPLITYISYLSQAGIATVVETGTSGLTPSESLLLNSILDAAGVRAAIGMAAANLDTQIAALPTAAEIQAQLGMASSDLDAQLDAIKAETAFILADTADMQPKLGTPAADISADIATRASSTEVTAIQNNTRVVFIVPEVIGRPTSGTALREAHIYLYDEIGNMEAPDSAPTMTLVNQAGTNLASRLDSTTMALVSSGHYKVVYTASNTDALEQLFWQATVVEGGITKVIGRVSEIVDSVAVDFTSTDRSNLVAVKAVTDNLPNSGALTNLDASVSSRATPAQVLAQINDALDAANTEPATVPAITGSLRDMIKYMFAWRRNKKLQTSTTMTLRNDADTADLATSAVSDDGTTLEVSKDA